MKIINKGEAREYSWGTMTDNGDNLLENYACWQHLVVTGKPSCEGKEKKKKRRNKCKCDRCYTVTRRELKKNNKC